MCAYLGEIYGRSLNFLSSFYSIESWCLIFLGTLCYKFILDLQKKKDAESGNVLKDLEDKLDHVSKAEVKASSDVKHAKDALNSEKKNLKQLEKNVTDNKHQSESKEKNIQKLESALKALEEKSKAEADYVLEAQNHYQAVSAGLSSNDDGEEKTLTG